MPRCETCGRVVTKDSIQIDEDMERTNCEHCREAGDPYAGHQYMASVVITEKCFEVAARAPNGELSLADSWDNVKAKLEERRRHHQEDDEEPKLQVVEGGAEAEG